MMNPASQNLPFSSQMKRWISHLSSKLDKFLKKKSTTEWRSLDTPANNTPLKRIFMKSSQWDTKIMEDSTIDCSTKILSTIPWELVLGLVAVLCWFKAKKESSRLLVFIHIRVWARILIQGLCFILKLWICWKDGLKMHARSFNLNKGIYLNLMKVAIKLIHKVQLSLPKICLWLMVYLMKKELSHKIWHQYRNKMRNLTCKRRKRKNSGRKHHKYLFMMTYSKIWLYVCKNSW